MSSQALSDDWGVDLTKAYGTVTKIDVEFVHQQTEKWWQLW